MKPKALNWSKTLRQWIPHIMALLMSPLAPVPAQAQTITIPVQVYLYRFAASPALDSSLSEGQVRAMFDQVNAIWSRAGVGWQVSTVVHAEASAADFPAVREGEDRATLRKKLVAASPKDSTKRTWKVVILREFPVPGGGVYLPETGTIYFAEVTRGDKTSPTILAHELGHTLGLPHLRETGNLMHRAAGARNNPQNTTALTQDQITTALRQAELGPIEGARGMEDGGDELPPGAQRNGEASPRSQGGPPRDRIVARMRSFDTDGDGRIHRADVPEGAQGAFRRIDANGDGVLDKAELDRFLQQ